MKAERSRLIPRNLTENLELLTEAQLTFSCHLWSEFNCKTFLRAHFAPWLAAHKGSGKRD